MAGRSSGAADPGSGSEGSQDGPGGQGPFRIGGLQGLPHRGQGVDRHAGGVVHRFQAQPDPHHQGLRAQSKRDRGKNRRPLDLFLAQESA